MFKWVAVGGIVLLGKIWFEGTTKELIISASGRRPACVAEGPIFDSDGFIAMYLPVSPFKYPRSDFPRSQMLEFV